MNITPKASRIVLDNLGNPVCPLCRAPLHTQDKQLIHSFISQPVRFQHDNCPIDFGFVMDSYGKLGREEVYFKLEQYAISIDYNYLVTKIRKRYDNSFVILNQIISFDFQSQTHLLNRIQMLLTFN